MRKSVFVSVVFGTLGLAGFVSAPLSVVLAHEAAQMECNETNINAINADIQSMPDGEAKATATTEIKMAEETMANKDMKTCNSHMAKAMEALEE